MKTIQEAAGGVLLYLYRENVNDPLSIDFKNFYFRYDNEQWADEQSFDEFQRNLITAVNGDEKLLLNALRFLISDNLITYTDNGSDSGGLMYRDLRVTSTAVKLIEGVDGKVNNTKKEFAIIFNFNLESILKIDSILKTKFGIMNL